MSLIDAICGVLGSKLHSGLIHPSGSLVGGSQGIHDGWHLWGAEPGFLCRIPERLRLHLPTRPNQLRLGGVIRHDHPSPTRLSLHHRNPKPLTHRASQQHVSSRIDGSQRALRNTHPIGVLVDDLVLLRFQPASLQQMHQVDSTHRPHRFGVQIEDRIGSGLSEDGERQNVFSE